MPAMDFLQYYGISSCNIVDFSFATFGIFILQQTSISKTILICLIFSLSLVACNVSLYSESDKNTSTKLTYLSPVEVVTQHLMAEKNNDTQAWISGLTSERCQDFSKDMKLGVISLNILDVKEETNPKYMENLLASKEAKDEKWTRENTTFVLAVYEVKIDHTLAPGGDGRMETVYALLRKDKDSPWYIQDWGIPLWK
jgi:hypothetical protein